MTDSPWHLHATARSATVLALVVWFVAAVIGGVAGVIDQPDRPPLVLLGFIAVPVVGFTAAYALSASLRRFTDRLSLTWIVGAHLWRWVGLGFIVAWLADALPAGFAIPDGLGDIAAAMGALALARGLHLGAASRNWLLAWNTFGLLDLLFAITTGVLYSNSSLGVLRGGGVSTELMVTFPVSLIPTFFVPLFILLHMLTFRRIADLGARSSAGAVALRMAKPMRAR